MTLHRPDWDDYFLSGARWVATRADCRRAQHGAIIVNPEHRVVAMGYNGSPPGGPSCLAGACTRGLTPPEEVPHLSGDYSDCIALHAEQNALVYAGRDARGGTIYITGQPCGMCAKLIAAAGIVRTVYSHGRVAISV